MKIHNFIVDSPNQEFHKVLFCTKCGQVAWHFNWNKALNTELQKDIKPCVEDDEIVKPTTP